MDNDFHNLLGKYAVEFHSLGLDDRKFKPKPRYNFLIDGYSFGGYAENVPITFHRAGIFDVDGVIQRQEFKGPTFLYLYNLAEQNRSLKNKFNVVTDILKELPKVKNLQESFDKFSILLQECSVTIKQHKKAVRMVIDYIDGEPNYFVRNLPETFLNLMHEYAFVSGFFSGGPKDVTREIAGMFDGIKTAFGFSIPFNKSGEVSGKIYHTLNENKARGRDKFLMDTIGRKGGFNIAFSDDYILDEALKNSAGMAKLGVNLNPLGWLTNTPREILPGDVVSPLPEAREDFSTILDFIDRYDSRVIEFHFLSLEKQIELSELALKLKKNSNSLFLEAEKKSKFEEIFSYVERMNVLKGMASSLTMRDLMRMRHEVESKNYSNESLKNFDSILDENFPEKNENEEKLLELQKSAKELLIHPSYGAIKIRSF